MTKSGLRKLQCEACGETREVEAGIRTMYHCAAKMKEVADEEAEAEGKEPNLRLKLRQ